MRQRYVDACVNEKLTGHASPTACTIVVKGGDMSKKKSKKKDKKKKKGKKGKKK